MALIAFITSVWLSLYMGWAIHSLRLIPRFTNTLLACCGKQYEVCGWAFSSCSGQTSEGWVSDIHTHTSAFVNVHAACSKHIILAAIVHAASVLLGCTHF